MIWTNPVFSRRNPGNPFYQTAQEGRSRPGPMLITLPFGRRITMAIKVTPIRPSASRRGYNSIVWERLRRACFVRDNYVCQE